MSLKQQYYDLLVIGTGLYGIQIARTYLEVHPNRNVLIFEASATIGGVWSAERMYDAFMTQSPLGMAGFSDQPLEDVPQDDQHYGFFKARHVTRYLEGYVKNHVYAGLSIADRIRLNSPVEQLSKHEDRWIVKVKGCTTTYETQHVVDASGLTSIPHMPELPDQGVFRGLLLHQKNFGKSDVLSNPRYQHIVVLGGAKSAADVAYAAAKSDKKVTWIIRKSGAGPAAFAPAEGNGPYKNSNEALFTRFTASFLASLFLKQSWWTRFLYRTGPGRALFNLIWANLNAEPPKLAEYNRPDGQKNGFSNLKPDTPMFWQNDSTGVLNHQDFFDTIATQVQVLRQDIRSMSEKGLILADGTRVDADAVICCTGWEISHPYLDNQTAARLGLPVPQGPHAQEDVVKWQDLDHKGELKALQCYPVLSNPPPHRKLTSPLSPLRLYKGMLPVYDHSILFLGKVMLTNHFRNAEVQALWAVAALDGNISLPSTEAMESDIADTVAWCRKRYLTKGELGNWLYFDTVPYTDMLPAQLGLKSHRKAWFKDLFAPCLARDLRGLIDEYKQKYSDKPLASQTEIRPKL